MDSTIEFLGKKFGVGQKSLDFEALINIAKYENIIIKWLDPENKSFKGMICWGEGAKRVDHPVIFITGKGNVDDLKKPSNWFALAHELGHYYLHPFLKYVDYSIFSPILQIEADQFATIIFIPTKELINNFEDKVMLALLSEKPYEEICKVRNDIFSYCVERTHNLLKIKKEDGLNREAKRNLLIKAQRFINSIEEKIILFFNDYPINIDKKKIQEENKDELLSEIKKYIYSYKEKY